MEIVPVAFFAARAPGVRRRYDDVHLEPDQLGCEIRQPVESTLRPSILDNDILALDPSEFAQSLSKRLEKWGLDVSEVAER